MVDNLIKLFESDATDFTTNGIGVLSGAESCLVTEERNGMFELEMVYPINGQHYDEIALRRIVVTKSNPYSDPQPFRIYDISKPINGRVTINAEHISYDLSGFPVAPFSVVGTKDLFKAITDARIKDIPELENFPFTFYTNKEDSEKEFVVSSPKSIRSLLGGADDTILGVFGEGEYEFDGYSVKLYEARGENRGTTIRYGKNLTDVKQEENCASVYTAIYPFWYSKTYGGLVTLPEKIIDAGAGYDFTRVLTVDLSSKFSKVPTEDALREEAIKYLEENEISVPTVSIDISFEQLSKTSDYKDFAKLEEVRLCDTVNVEFPKLGVSATAKCIKTVYDAISGKYSKIELGSAKSNIANSLSAQSKTIKDSPSREYLEGVVQAATDLATGNAGGYVVIHNSKGEKEPDEILIMDTDDIKTATNVWRWNMRGLSFSPNGYTNDEKNYSVAITQDGSINASFIKVGELSAISIVACDFKSSLVGNEKEPRFSVTSDGKIKATTGEIGVFTIDRRQISMEGSSARRWANVLGTKDSSTFEIVVFEDNGSSQIKINELQSKSISAETVNVQTSLNVSREIVVNGTMTFRNESIYIDNKQVIWFNYNPGGSRTITATLEINWASTNVTVRTSEPLSQEKSFTINLHTTWGGWAHTVTITVPAGGSEQTITEPGPFWGYDDGYFVASGSKEYRFSESSSSYIDFCRNIEPYNDGKYDLGSKSYRWNVGYIHSIIIDSGTVGEGGETITSDRNKKKDILELSDRYDELFDRLKPVSFRFRKNTSNRIHVGFIAQDVGEAMEELGIPSTDFAAYCKMTENGNDEFGLRYTEFIALNTFEIQRLKMRISQLEKLIKG